MLRVRFSCGLFNKDFVCEKVPYFHSQFLKNNHAFNAYKGWLDNFKKRLKMSGEKLSSRGHHQTVPS